MKNHIKKNLNKIVLAVFIFAWPALSFADYCTTNPSAACCTTNPSSCPTTTTTGNVTINNPLTNTPTLTDLIHNILIGAIKIGMPIIVLAIIYCGFLFVAARGNSEKLSDAKRALTYTLIGAAILLGSWAIATLITSTVQAL